MKRLLTLAFSLILGLGTARALDWPVTHLKREIAPLQKVTDLSFEFTNNSDKPVTITSVDSSCDCLEAAASAKSFAPGASGRILARFTVGDRVGIYRRTIIVSTDEGTAPVALTVELDVPELASLSPRSVEWKVNDPAAGKAVEIAVAPGLELVFSHVQATSDAFTHRLEAIEPGRRYRLHLAPKSTRETANAAFRLHARAATGEDLIFSAYANVR